MLLAVDVGNTQTHLGAFDGEELVEHWRFQTRSGATGDELGERVAGFFELSGMGFDDDRRGRRLLGGAAARHPVRADDRALPRGRLPDVGPGVKTGMPIRIDNPLEVGADRLVNAIAAYERFGKACVVGRLRHRDQLRRRLRRGRVPRRRDRARARDLADRADRARRRIPRIELAEPRDGDRPLDPRGDPVRLHLRLRRADRRRSSAGSKRNCRTRSCSPPAASPSAIVPFSETIDEVDDLLTLKGLRLIHERNAS